MEQSSLPSNVLIFPLPAQGHVNSMLKLAQLLCLAGHHVTFLNSDFIHRRLLLHTDVQSRFAAFAGFRFETISDGLPEDHPRSGDRLMELFDSINSTTVSLFREFLVSNRRNPDNRPPVTCIVADGIFSFAIDVANELGIPIISFRTISACAFWAYYCIPELVDNGELPFEEADMDLQVKSIPGMESFLRRRDLPNFCRANSISDPILQLVKIETRETRRSQGLILNTFEDLEGPILSEIRAHFAHVYAIGPLHTHLKSKLPLETTTYSSGNSLWQEDRSCMKWLDSKDFRSVLYVSFGSLTVITRNELIEFWHGLVNSEKHFLWVMRPDLITLMIHISKEARQQRSRGKQRRQPQCDQRGFYLPSSTTSKRRTNRGTEVSTQSHKGKSNVISGASLVIIIHSQTRHTISGTGASTYCNNGQHNVIRSDLLPLIIHNSKEDPQNMYRNHKQRFRASQGTMHCRKRSRELGGLPYATTVRGSSQGLSSTAMREIEGVWQWRGGRRG